MSEKKIKIQKSNTNSTIYAKRRFEKWMEGNINKEIMDGFGIDRLNKKKLLRKYTSKIKIT